jgi:fatty-acyl-CoA synthase
VSLLVTSSTAAALVRGRAGDEAVGVVFGEERWTWAQFVDEAAARAAWLRSQLDDARPPHVGALLENTPEYLFLLAGAALAGTTVVGINPTRRGAELARDINHTDCQLVLTEPAQAHLLDGLDLGGVPVHDVESLTFEAAPMPDVEPSEDTLLLLLFTSGSTGAPKAVRFSQGRAFRAANRVPFQRSEVIYSAMPMFHGNALNAAVFPSWASGCTLVLRRRFSASGFLPDVRRYGCTFFNTVGRAIAHINATPPQPDDGEHPLKWVLGPETSDSDKQAFTARFGVPIFEGYGSTENAIILNPAPKARPGALGVATGNQEVVVLDPATGRPCPTAEFDDDGRLLNAGEAIGELVGRGGRANFEGYYRNDEAEAERIRDGDYWSGDLAYQDADGVFYFAGRGGDWLRVDSENFAAAPVERILNRWGGATGTAVYGVPDSRTGDQVMAALEVVVPSSFDADAFATWLDAQTDLGTKWAPRYLRLVEALPTTATDKVDKAPLRAARWRTDDPVWWRPAGASTYRPFTAGDLAALEAEFEQHRRSNLLA